MQDSMKNNSIIVRAMENIIGQFYSKQTSNVFIAFQSSQENNESSKPADVAEELIKLDSSKVSMTYVIESNSTINQMYLTINTHQRIHNIFVVDSYESFRQVSSLHLSENEN